MEKRRMKLVISPEYEHLREWLSEDKLIDSKGGDVLYNGRNRIVSYSIPSGEKIVIKKHRKHDIIKRFIYSLFRANKARRSFENAIELRKRGFSTPHEVAYAEQSCMGLVIQVYYICAFTDYNAIRPELIDREPFDKELAVAYAEYVASLHEAGVLHRDLNPTNVLYKKEKGRYAFELIDINRMRFYKASVPKAECMENLTLFWWLSDVYRYILDVYAAKRGWCRDDVNEALCVKQRHDSRWIWRKRFTGWLKRNILRK